MKEKETIPNDKDEASKETKLPVYIASTRTSKRRYRRGIFAGILIVLFCFAAGFGGAQLYTMLSNRNNNSVTERQTTASDGNKVVTPEEEGITKLVDKVSPSVVSIVTTSRSTSLFGVQEEEGAGTGIIVGKDGYILTNKHVVRDTNTVSVVLSDGTNYDDVKVIGSDPLNDVAFLKIPNVSNLPAAELGDSTSVRVGQNVVAIGNSLGQYQNTVTSGIISGKGRPISAQAGESVENLTDLLQTDAAINPGNSGGPLLNLQGQVIGINTAIVEDAQGIGFAIPISATKGMLKGVLAGKPVERAYVGVNFIPITADVAKQYNLPVKKGAYVFNTDNRPAVLTGGPADRAGIKGRDIITKVGGIDVGDKGSVSTLVAEYAPDDTIELTILRGGQTVTVKITLEVYQTNP